MNPYDFVPVSWDISPERHPSTMHDKFEGISGHLTAVISAETPVFIKTNNNHTPKTFIKNKDNKYIIPATSLKGLFRNLVETVANGCFSKFDEIYRKGNQKGKINLKDGLPEAFRLCFKPENLCTSCRIFGWLKKEGVFEGKVCFQDAICINPIEHEPIHTIDLMGPKPHHTAFYMKEDKIAGRKYYFHFPQGLTLDNRDSKFSQYIIPLDKGSKFSFSAHFTNLEESEWQALLYAIVLEESMRHKIGYAKPSGLGSIKIEITNLTLRNMKKRYTDFANSEIHYSKEINPQDLNNYIASQISGFTTNTNSPVLNSLRYIWNWDPNNTTSYHYPTAVDRNWFENNHDIPIKNTP